MFVWFMLTGGLCRFLVVRGLTLYMLFFFFFQAEDGIRDLVRSRGLGDVYKRQPQRRPGAASRNVGLTR